MIIILIEINKRIVCEGTVLPIADSPTVKRCGGKYERWKMLQIQARVDPAKFCFSHFIL
jgi:hypothetical protein